MKIPANRLQPPNRWRKIDPQGNYIDIIKVPGFKLKLTYHMQRVMCSSIYQPCVE